MNKFYAILINFMGSKAPLTETVQAKLATIAPDWLRLAPGQYIVSTTQTAEAIYAALKPLLNPNDFILVVEVNINNRMGWAQQIAIDWIKRHSP